MTLNSSLRSRVRRLEVRVIPAARKSKPYEIASRIHARSIAECEARARMTPDDRKAYDSRDMRPWAREFLAAFLTTPEPPDGWDLDVAMSKRYAERLLRDAGELPSASHSEGVA